ncbi:MAG: alpha/beta hydrolase [Actinobacteria bacterium]|nr:alpha/beta hydrolase [Actinomycetota bacterium]
MAHVEVNGVRLFCTDEGAGETTVLLVHGWGCESNDWIWQIPALASAGHRVIVPDLRGHGGSAAAGPCSPFDHAADLAALLEELGTGPVVAAGHSLGGVVTMALAVEYPELVRGLIQVDAAYGVEAETIELVEQMRDLLQGLEPLEVIAGIWPNLEGPNPDPALAAWHRRRLLAQAPENVVGNFMAHFFEEDQFALRPAADAYLVRCTRPILGFHVEAPKEACETATFQHPASHTVFWDDVGHWLHQERPQDFNRLALDWIAEVATMKEENDA